MLHLLPVESRELRPAPYAEAVSRLAGIRHALRLVEPFADGPSPDNDEDAAVAAAWDDAGHARRTLFDRRSERLIGAAAAGLEALLIEQGEDRAPHREASRALVEEIRRELTEIARVVIA